MKRVLKTVLAVAVIAAGCLLAGGCEMQQQDQLTYRERIVQEGTAYLAQIDAQEYTAGTVTPVSGTGWYCVPMTAQGKEPFNVFIRPAGGGEVEIRNDRVLQGLSRQLSAQWDKLLPQNAAGKAWVTFSERLPLKQWSDTESLQTVADGDSLMCRWYLVVPQKDAATLRATAQELETELAAQGWTGVLYAAAVPQSTMDTLTRTEADRDAWKEAVAEGLSKIVTPER